MKALIKFTLGLAGLGSVNSFEASKPFGIELEKVPIKDDDIVGPKSEGMATAEFDVAYGHKYMGFIHIGSSQQAVNVTFDTASPYVAVTSSLCDSTCKTKSFSQSDSFSAQNRGE